VLLEQQKQDAGTKITGLNEALALARGELSLAKCRVDELSKKVQVLQSFGLKLADPIYLFM
jgi:hypothetical protein